METLFCIGKSLTKLEPDSYLTFPLFIQTHKPNTAGVAYNQAPTQYLLDYN